MKAIREMWVKVGGFHPQPSGRVNELIEIRTEYDLTIDEWHYWAEMTSKRAREPWTWDDAHRHLDGAYDAACAVFVAAQSVGSPHGFCWKCGWHRAAHRDAQ